MSTDDKHEDGALEQTTPNVRQPWEPPTEEETAAAVKDSLAQFSPAGEEGEEENKPDGAAKPEGDEGQQEKPKEKEKAEDEPAKGESEETKEQGKEGEDAALPARQDRETPKPSGLDKRIATLYLQNLALSELPVPELDSVLEELTGGQFTHDQKMQMMHLHRKQNKELRGVDARKAEPQDREDSNIIREAEREQIRSEIRQEEQQKADKDDFIKFLDEHPELDEENDGYNPAMAIAVQTLWEGGMPIRNAFQVVTHQFEAVKVESAKNQEKAKQKALSGAMSVSTKTSTAPNGSEYTWAEFNQLMIENPAEWERLIKAGYSPKG